MTKVTIYRNSKKECVGFKAVDHAGYAVEGEDIVCAAISILTINTINALETFTNIKCSLKTDEKRGIIEYKLSEEPTKETTLLLDTMVLGLQAMVDDENYADYIDLKFEEV